MELSINTPALLFPAISLLLLAYTNRFLAIANLVRRLFDEYNKVNNKENLALQIKSLRKRLNYIRYMQGFGVFSFLLCVGSMYFIYNMWEAFAKLTFAISLFSLMISLIFSLIEIFQSTSALELLLSEVEGLTEQSLLDKVLHRKEETKI
jgi:ABC-type glycerol-3-phosphate transport system permease component